MPLPRIRVKTVRKSLHPWIFEGMVNHPGRSILPGTLVEIEDRDGHFAGRGIYNPKSRIALRILTDDPNETLDADFFRRRIEEALRFRRETLKLDAVTDAYRIVHAEADGLSGLVIDRFGPVVVVQLHSAGYTRILDWITGALRALLPECRPIVRTVARVEAQEGVTMRECETPLADIPEIITTTHGLRMRVDLKSGHKTGFFLDQRDNRQRVAGLAVGAEVLDLCCYTGGFALAAIKAGAKSAIGVDLDEEALPVARENARLNGLSAEFVHANVFDYMRKCVADKRQFDVVVLDPSKLAQVREEIPRAMAMYRDMNVLAMQVTRPGGILLTCSCSGLVGEPEFLAELNRAATIVGCDLQVFHIAGAAPDHPFTASFPEGRYLKAVFARVKPSPAFALHPSLRTFQLRQRPEQSGENLPQRRRGRRERK
jgi:23S rRNA (cytosine1962-C5)-methyltransferase